MRTCSFVRSCPLLCIAAVFSISTLIADPERELEAEGGWRIDATGWAKEKGRARVKNVESIDDDGAPTRLVVEGEGEVEIDHPKRHLRRRSMEAEGNSEQASDVTFYEVRISPALAEGDWKTAQFPVLDLGGAVVGLRIVGEKGSTRMAELVALAKRERGAKDAKWKADDWVRTGIFFNVNANGYVSGQIPIVARVDEAAGVWDLYVYEKMALAELPYQKRLENVVFRSVSEKETRMEGIRVSDSNPLFEDEDSDGIPDSFARRHGNAKRDDVLGETGSTLLVEYLIRPRVQE